MTPVRLEPAALRSGVKHSTTEPLRSLTSDYMTSRLIAIHSQELGIVVSISSSVTNLLIAKYSTTNMFIVLITNNRRFLIFKISQYRRDNMFNFKFTG